MFGGPPQQASKEEIQAAEFEANAMVTQTATIVALLYFSPFVIDYVRKLV